MKEAADLDTSAQAMPSLPTFAEAIETNKAMVFSIAWHFLRDRSVAEELAQDVFLQLHRCWESMQSRQHITHWLRRTASNRCIDEVRRKRVKRESSLTEAAEPTTLEQLQDPLLSAYLQRMVASLPEKQRLMVILRYQEEMEPEEISKMLGMKSSTVKTLLGRAIELLRSKTLRRLAAKEEEER
jgi:RNA polymerase sigma-70 factor (ECF subfamily)